MARVGSSAKFGVVVFKASILDSGGPLTNVGSCTGIQGISVVVPGGPLAKAGSSTKCGVLIQGISALVPRRVHWPKKVCLPSLV